MKIFVIFLIITFLFDDVHCGKNKHHRGSNSNKIVGGYNATIEEFPYQVLLIVLKNDEFSECGGSIISNKTILTAAHCLTGASIVYVKMGATSSSSDGGDTVLSENFTPHPNYNRKTSDYDIGIVTLDIGIQLDGTKKKIVRLADRGKQVKPGQNVTVSGWGTTSENGEGSDSLLAVDVPVVSNDECRKSYRTLSPRMFCAGVPEGGKDACQGDSGGPAVIKSNGIQVGVVSYGIGCARKGYPGVYTSVSSVRDWINKVSGV